MDSLFPQLPAKLADLSDKELADLLAEHEEAAGLIDADDQEFLSGLSADEIIEQYKAGADQIKTLNAETAARVEAEEAFSTAKAEISKDIGLVKAEAEEAEEEASEDAEAVADDDSEEAEGEEASEEAEAEAEKVLVASAEEETEAVETEKPRLRRPPAPAADRVVVNEEPAKELAFVASGLLPSTPPGTVFKSQDEIVQAKIKLARSLGAPKHTKDGEEVRYPVAQLDYSSNFPEERTLHSSDWEANSRKIAAVGNPFMKEGLQALTASGGLCAPLEPIYTMPQFAVTDRPVRDALPNFRAERGGINVPTPTTIGDAAAAITTITEANDALGGTFATKACLDLSCPNYTETAVTIISHCREYGNLNAMAWPEKIAHENELTMAAHARTAEEYLLERIKTQSVNVTVGLETLSALVYTLDGILKMAWGIRTRLRLPRTARFQLLAPQVLLDILMLDTVQTQYDRYRTREDIDNYLASAGVDITYYLDTPSTGDSQIADTAQTAAAIDPFPDHVQMALFPAGAFLHIDMAELNLGIVRDSTLNSTNDFQNFGETFENVALVGPAQSAMWITADICAVGQFPPAGTARTCD